MPAPPSQPKISGYILFMSALVYPHGHPTLRGAARNRTDPRYLRKLYRQSTRSAVIGGFGLLCDLSSLTFLWSLRQRMSCLPETCPGSCGVIEVSTMRTCSHIHATASATHFGAFCRETCSFFGDNDVESLCLPIQHIAHGALQDKGYVVIGVRLLYSQSCTREVYDCPHRLQARAHLAQAG